MTAPSFTAFKRQLFVGMPVHIENLKFPHLTGERVLSKVQGNAVAGWVTRDDGENVESWIYWPRASDVVMNDHSSASLLNPDTRQPWLTVSVLP